MVPLLPECDVSNAVSNVSIVCLHLQPTTPPASSQDAGVPFTPRHYAVRLVLGLASLFAGGATVHSFYKPDLVWGDRVCVVNALEQLFLRSSLTAFLLLSLDGR